MALAMGLTGYWALSRVDVGMSRMIAFNNALGHHLDAQGLFNAVKADVLTGLLAVDAATSARAAAEFHEHAAPLRSRLDDNRKLFLTPDIDDGLEGLRVRGDAYLREAEKLIALSAADSLGAVSRYGDFLKLSTGFEEDLSRVGGLLEQAAGATKADEGKTVDFSRRFLLGVSLALMLVLGAAAFVISRSITASVDLMLHRLEAVSVGDLTARLDDGALGGMAPLARSFNAFLERLQAVISRAGDTMKVLSEAAGDLTTTANQMKVAAESTDTQAVFMSAASEEVSKNTHTVVSSVEEVHASIKEISHSASEAARVADGAVKKAQGTVAAVEKLGASGAEIESVLKLITSIAEQTNLLALNATIEAARAGEAGKGFAVVANEVKDLAKETAKAIEDIGQRIGTIQTDSRGAAAAVKEINGVVLHIHDLQTSIAGAVEQQATAMSDIGRNITEALQGSNDINKNVVNLAVAAKSTSKNAGDLQDRARTLTRLASELQTLITQFRY